MKTFSEEKKQHWIKVMKDHQETDRLIRGQWLDDKYLVNGAFRGCFFGCAMQTEDNPLDKAVKEMDLPPWLVYLSEKIYEELPEGKHMTFPVDLLEAIPVDTYIEHVRHQIAIKRLEPLIKESNGEAVNNAIKEVIGYHKNPSEESRTKAHLAASGASAACESWSSAWEAAVQAAVRAAAEWSVSESAWSVSESARSAAESEESAVAVAAVVSVVWRAREAVRESAWLQERDNLISALRDC